MSIRNKTFAVVAGVAVFAAVSASAASLGGVETSDLGANSNSVKAQLADGVGVSFDTEYDSTLGAYVVSAVNLTALGAGSIPATAQVQLTLKDVSGDSLGELTGTGSTLSAPSNVLAHDVYGVSLVINGGTVTAAVDATP